jgi:hypothetical protein
VNRTATCITTATDSAEAARELGRAIRIHFDGAAPDAVAVFASARHDYERLLGVLAGEVGTTTIVGASSAGEFAGRSPQAGAVSALAIRSTDMRFAVGVGHDISRDPLGAARQVVAGFRGAREGALPYRAALVMTDALAGHTDALVEELTVATGGGYVFFGGGAGDDGRFSETHVFAGTRAYSNAVAALEIQSSEPLGVGVSHGWEPASPALRVTEVEGSRVASLNGAPAVDAFVEHAARTGQAFDPSDPLPFFLHNILGISTSGEYRLRVPLGVDAEGAVLCAAAVPLGAVVHVMATNEASAVAAAQKATRAALASLGGRRPGGALVFDCVATRLRLGKAFDNEVDACAELLQPAPMVGCNTYGQIARAEGQFGGFHNCTAVVCVLPE